MERVNLARAVTAQQEGVSTLRRNVSPAGPALDETSQPGAIASGSLSPQFTHHPGRFTIYPSGRSGPVPYRAGMERAFSADLTGVRAYYGASALLTGSGAPAAAWPETLVFASPDPSPRLVAHEVGHILQYRQAASPVTDRRGLASHRDPAEAEAGRAARLFEAGASIQVQTHPTLAPMFYTDEEPGSDEFLAERPPLFAGQEVGIWGSSWPPTLIARERLDVSVREAQRSHAIVETIARREPIVILHEYGRLCLYRLEWEGLSGPFSSNNRKQVRHAAREACLLYQDIDWFIHQAVVTYQHTVHSELDGLTPHEKWVEGMQSGIPLVPPATTAMQRLFWRMNPGTRVINSKGICAFGMDYWSPDLSRAQRVGKNGQPIPFTFRYDPADISCLALFQDGARVGDVHAKQLRQPNGSFCSISLTERQLAQKMARQAGQSPRDWLCYIQDIDTLSQTRHQERRVAKRKSLNSPARLNPF